MSYFTPQFPSLQSPAHLMGFYTVEYETYHVFGNNELCVCHEISKRFSNLISYLQVCKHCRYINHYNFVETQAQITIANKY